MKKRVIIVHGWEGTPQTGWIPWLRDELGANGFFVTVPQMPETMTPSFDKWIAHLKKVVGKVNQQTYFVGHSLGCITILRFIEQLKASERVGDAVLVAGFGKNLNYQGYKNELGSFFQKPVDFEKIKSQAKKFIAIASDNDIWVPLSHAEFLKEKLGARVIVKHNMHHFDQTNGILKLPDALSALLQIAK